MKRLGYAAGIILFMLILVTCAMPEAPARIALVYGISIYDTDYPEGYTPANNLRLTDDDAIAMDELLNNQGWIVKAGIANTQVQSESQDATRAAIEQDIKNLEGTDGVVLFYYSGHGTVNSLTMESQIIPFGAVENILDRVTARELKAMFEAAGLKNVIIILDSCNSGGFVDAGSTVDAVSPIFGKYDETGIYDTDGDVAYTWFIDSLNDSVKSYISYSKSSRYVVISAAGAGEFSWEGGSNGIFTAAILASQKSNAADRDGNGYVDTTELYIFCAETINSGWNSLGTYPSGNWDVFFPHLSGTPREYALWATN